MLTKSLPTADELKGYFDSGDYETARKRTDYLFRHGTESEMRLAAVVHGAAYTHFHQLARNGGRKTAENLVQMFPECSFHIWLKAVDKQKLNKARRRK